jgi:hypothetical protein
MCFGFRWCTILLKSFIYLFIYLFITQGLVIAKASTTSLEPVWQVHSFINYIITFSIPLYNSKYFYNILWVISATWTILF